MRVVKIAIISGNFPPDICGVGDYTEQLINVLNECPVEISKIHSSGWGIRDFFSLRLQLDKIQPDVINIQYPTQAYGASIVPHLLALTARCPVLLTLHEFSDSHWLRRLSIRFLALKPGCHMIFTSMAEKKNFNSSPRLFRQDAADVIPISSNIPLLASTGYRAENSVAYFGMLRPDKGIEEFLELVRLARVKGSELNFVIIGACPEKDRHYCQQQIELARKLGIEVCLNLSPDCVAKRLSKIRFGYLPFPDGASARRGSLLAMLGNGICVLTRKGESTPTNLDSCVLYTRNPEHALQVLCELTIKPECIDGLVSAGIRYVRQHSWSNIAQQYMQIIKRLVKTD